MLVVVVVVVDVTGKMPILHDTDTLTDALSHNSLRHAMPHQDRRLKGRLDAVDEIRKVYDLARFLECSSMHF